jgi:hypothetical protein
MLTHQINEPFDTRCVDTYACRLSNRLSLHQHPELIKKKEKQLNSSNPAAHDSVDVFLPYFLDPQFSSSSNTSTGSSLDGFELEAAAIELFAEI